ncbi:MAG: ATP-binding domain-containing protein [Scytonema sp. RU_4_4]|nr:ATP-binding domain-containing protein [Scytonema sp. RU_4_4]
MTFDFFVQSPKRVVRKNISRTNRDRDNYEQLKESLNDRLEAIMAIYDAIGHQKSLDSFTIYTEDLFSDTDEESVIYLSTVHSAKGLERDDIVIVKPDDLPMRWRNILPWQEQQEDNLHYVALTRAKNRLIIVGDCSWYTPPKPQQEDSGEDEEAPDIIDDPAGENNEVCGSHTQKPGTLSQRDLAYYGMAEPLPDLVASVPVEEEPTDEELTEAVKKAIARFGPKNIILQAVQQATVSEIAEIMAILDDW